MWYRATAIIGNIQSITLLCFILNLSNVSPELFRKFLYKERRSVMYTTDVHTYMY